MTNANMQGDRFDAARLPDVVRHGLRSIAAGDFASADAVLQIGKRRWPNAPSLGYLEARLADAQGRAAEAAGLFRKASIGLAREIELNPNPHKALLLARASLKLADADAAASALALAKKGGIEPLGALSLERSIALARKDWPAMRRAASEILALSENPRATDFTALALACRNTNDFEAAIDAAERALERDASQIEAATIAATAAMQLGDVDRAIAARRRLNALAPENPRMAFQSIRLLILSGSVGDGARELDAALAKWPRDPALRAFALVNGFRAPSELAKINDGEDGDKIDRLRERQLRSLDACAPRDDELRRPLMSDDKKRDVIVAPAAGADVAVLVFTALTDSISMPLPTFDRYMAALGVSAVYLKDFQRLFFLRGIRSLGSNLSTTAAALRATCDSLSARRIYALGMSAGGFASIRYGVDLGAVKVVSFAGETHATQSEYTNIEQGVALIKRRLAANVSIDEQDLRQFLSSRPHSTAVDLFYPEDSTRDRVQAMHLKGMSGVSMRPIHGCDDHELVRWLALRGDLREILARSLSPDSAV